MSERGSDPRVPGAYLLAAAVLLATCASHVLAATPAPTPAPCKSSAEKGRIEVSLTPPSGVALAGLKVLVAYPKGKVTIPGTANEPSVLERVTEPPKDFLFVVNDLEDALRVAMVSAANTVGKGKLFGLELNRCEGVPMPRAEEFKCTVEDAATMDGKAVAGVGCHGAASREITKPY